MSYVITFLNAIMFKVKAGEAVGIREKRKRSVQISKESEENLYIYIRTIVYSECDLNQL